jgi:hypothetical protein
VNCSRVTRGGGFHARIPELKPNKMGLQVPCGVDTEMQKEDALWADQKNFIPHLDHRIRWRCDFKINRLITD